MAPSRRSSAVVRRPSSRGRRPRPSRAAREAASSSAAWATRSRAPLPPRTHALVGAQPAQPASERRRQRRARPAQGGGGERDDARGGRQVVHGGEDTPPRRASLGEDGRVGLACCCRSFCSPGTGAIDDGRRRRRADRRRLAERDRRPGRLAGLGLASDVLRRRSSCRRRGPSTVTVTLFSSLSPWLSKLTVKRRRRWPGRG